MYKYGISYYQVVEGVRVPWTGLDVRLLSPGDAWANGMVMSETGTSGYYECVVTEAADCGFYEIWDDSNNPAGEFSGKCCLIGQMDARGLQNACIYGNHIEDGAVSSGKIANGAILPQHMGGEVIGLSTIVHECQDQDDGKGDISEASPPAITDGFSTHVFENEYTVLPHIILTSKCNCELYVSDASLNGGELTVVVGIGYVHGGEAIFYDLLVIGR